ncbi:MAG: HD domain-containing protein [Solirubrobacterales bacterium]
MSGLEQQLDRARTVDRVGAPLANEQAWLVGGTVRDLVMARPVEDFDIAVRGEAESSARRIARAHDAHVFPLSEEFGAWRVTAADRSWQADVTSLREGSIESDLALRDFTINAMALPLARRPEPPDLVDPHEGVSDIEARRLRVVGARSYSDDPLRVVRMARLACELGFEVEPQTLALATAHAAEIERVAAERVFYELRRVIASPDPLRGFELMDSAALLAVLLPELEALKGVGQNPYHHLDVWGHTFEVLRCMLDLERGLDEVFGDAASRVESELGRPLADELTRGEALRFAALFHDLGKPATRTVNEEGRVLFWGHDEVGARISIDICRRLHASSALGDYLAALARHHLRLGFMVHERPLTRRHVYRYMRTCEPVEVEVTVLSVADRLATAGSKTKPQAIEGHLEVARELMPQALTWRTQGPPEPPLRGDELIDELGIESGPQVGHLLELIREATFAGDVRSREAALELARSAL